MTAIIVIASILMGFYVVGCIRPHVIISMKKYMNVYVKVFFIKIRVFTNRKGEPPDEELDLPVKKKKPPKKKPPKPKKPKVKKDKNEPKKPQPITFGIDILKMLAMVKDVLGSLFVELWRYFRVRVKNFHIVIATGDAAQTAMMYGAVCGYGDAILSILGKALDFKVEKGAKVGAECDYLSDEMKMDVEIDISISIGMVFRFLFNIIGAAVAGALRGIKLGINKQFFSQKKQYKQDMVKYTAEKAAKEAKEAQKAEKEEKLNENSGEEGAKAESAPEAASGDGEEANAPPANENSEPDTSENNTNEENINENNEETERENNHAS